MTKTTVGEALTDEQLLDLSRMLILKQERLRTLQLEEDSRREEEEKRRIQWSAGVRALEDQIKTTQVAHDRVHADLTAPSSGSGSKVVPIGPRAVVLKWPSDGSRGSLQVLPLVVEADENPEF